MHTIIVCGFKFVGSKHLDSGESLHTVLTTQSSVLISVHSSDFYNTLEKQTEIDRQLWGPLARSNHTFAAKKDCIKLLTLNLYKHVYRKTETYHSAELSLCGQFIGKFV